MIKGVRREETDMWHLSVITLLATLGLSACEAYRAPPLINKAGPVIPTDLPPPANEGDSNPYKEFARTYQVAMKSRSASDAKVLRDQGFALIWSNCSDFFAYRGNVQQGLGLFKDTTSALTPIATGVISIARATTSAVPILSLGQAATSGGINVVADNFLFGADNIDDVRTLILNALAAHVAKVREEATKSPEEAGFDWSTNQLLENQAICQPAKMLALSKEAKKDAEAETQKANDKKPAAGAGGLMAGASSSAAIAASAVPNTPLLPARIGVRVEN
jgi:hypothetical protein